MRFLTIIFISFFLSSPAFSNEWISPIDKKYAAKNPELFAKFSEARDILNSWRGRTHKLIKAKSFLDEVIKADDNYAPAHREYGRYYIMAGYINSRTFKEGSLEFAENTILNSIAIEPDYADSYVLLGHLYTVMEKNEKAKKALTKAEEIGTEIPWLDLNWADFLTKHGEYGEALKRCQRVIDSKTTNKKAYAAALSYPITIYKRMKRYDDVNEAYKKSIEFEPEDAWEWGEYSSFLLTTYNDVDGAIEKGRTALNLMDYGAGRLTLAGALYTKWAFLIQNPEKKEEAQKYFDEAYAIYPFLERIIHESKKYEYTKITASELSKLIESQKE